MLISYSVSNFKSIRNKEEISFKPKPLKSKKEILKNDLLPVISIYGPNGGGKSSLIHSFGYLVLLLRKVGNDRRMMDTFLNDLSIYRNSSKKDDPTEWEIECKVDQYIFRYYISVSKDRILSEELQYKNNYNEKYKNIFIYKDGEIILDKELFRNYNKLPLNQINGSIFGYLSLLGVDIELFKIFSKEVKKFYHMGDPSMFSEKHDRTSGIVTYNCLNVTILKENKDILLSVLKDVDMNVNDVEFVKEVYSGNDMIFLCKTIAGKNVKINFISESEGTKKLIQLISLLIIVFRDGGVLFIDELDSQFHTKLLGYIINLFYSKNNKESQLVYTSHDMATLSSEYFRKDQIYFAALNESNFTDLICLNDFGQEIREASSFSKKYLSGDLGYDPYITKAIENEFKFK